MLAQAEFTDLQVIGGYEENVEHSTRQKKRLSFP